MTPIPLPQYLGGSTLPKHQWGSKSPIFEMSGFSHTCSYGMLKKRFVCDVCGRRLVTKQALQNHKAKVGACEKFLILSEKKKAMIEQVCVLDSSIGKYFDGALRCVTLY